MSPVESLGHALHAAAHESEPDVVTAVHGGLERGRRKRRNRRIAQVAGSTAGIVAVGAVGVFAAEGTPNRHVSTPVHPPTTSSATPKPHRTPPQVPVTVRSDKLLDIRMHLPELLQQALPSGTTVAAAPKDWTTVGGATFVVSNAGGQSEVHVTSRPLYDAPATTDFAAEFCVRSDGVAAHCDTRKVAGGTVYIANEDKTAADDAGGKPPAGVYQPGHENDVVWRGLRMGYVPDDHSLSTFQIEETTQVEAVPYASSPPAGSKYYQWPPTNNDVKGAVGTGLTISPDDFAALVGKPQLDRMVQLLDPEVPVSQSAIAERDAINAQLMKLAAPVLPAGLKLSVNYAEFSGNFLVLTGPTGVNGLQWYTDKHSHGLLATNNLKCRDSADHCETRKVPGATVQVVDQADAQSGFYTFEYVPDDPNGKEVSIMLTGDPAAQVPGPAAAKKSPRQLTDEQMLAIVTNPDVARIMNETSLLGK